MKRSSISVSLSKCYAIFKLPPKSPRRLVWNCGHAYAEPYEKTEIHVRIKIEAIQWALLSLQVPTRNAK